MYECREEQEKHPPKKERAYLTEPQNFRNVARGKPRPYTLKGQALIDARLTPKTWRLEIVSDGSTKVERPRQLKDKSAIDLATIEALGKRHGVKFLKAMQCNNIAQPLGQGLWEGVPMREVLKLAGNLDNIRRVYWWGFHNNDPKQVFQSSLSYNKVMETPPWDLPVFVAYKLNGRPISLLRGGPVRMIVPWAHGFKSIKWLQRITLTNDHRANDTYANGNNAVDSYLKTAAYIDSLPQAYGAGEAITITGSAMSGWSGLRRVEYWLRRAEGRHGDLAPNDPAWKTARWQPCRIEPPPKDWGGSLPGGVLPRDVWGFDRKGRPKEWPLRFSVGLWSVQLKGLKPGAHEFRVRTVDMNGFAQPEPRPYRKSGRNAIECFQFMVNR